MTKYLYGPDDLLKISWDEKEAKVNQQEYLDLLKQIEALKAKERSGDN